MRQERRNNTRTQREREEEENKEGDGGIKEWGTSWWDDLVSPETHARLKRQDGQSASVWNAEAKQWCVYACVCVRSCVCGRACMYVCVVLIPQGQGDYIGDVICIDHTGEQGPQCAYGPRNTH